MAIALEADFRSIKTSQAGEPPERPQGKTGSGEAFANSLARAKNADTAEPADAPPDTSSTVVALPFPPPINEPAITPEAEAAVATEAPALGADAAADILRSEIAVDRQFVREGVEAQADSAADLKAGADAVAARAQAALATVDTISEASEAPATATNPNAAAQEAGKISAQAAAQSNDSDRAPVAARVTAPDAVVAAPAIVAAVAGAPPATTTGNTKAPDTRHIQPSEAPADPGAFALMAEREQGATRDIPLTDTGIAPLTDIAGKGTLLDTASLNSTSATGTQTLAAVAAPAAPQTASAAPVLIASAPAFAVVTASPVQIVDIVAETADDGQSDRVVVQLDPPELGRVSIDFKFDAQGLQHVTITSETPEAMRQLRQMHSELVQSLERHGIGSENLSFQHQQQGSPQSPPPNPFARAAVLGDPGTGNASAAIVATTDSTPNARTLPGGRLDIRL